jgi:hypothetical protein
MWNSRSSRAESFPRSASKHSQLCNSAYTGRDFPVVAASDPPVEEGSEHGHVIGRKDRTPRYLLRKLEQKERVVVNWAVVVQVRTGVNPDAAITLESCVAIC